MIDAPFKSLSALDYEFLPPLVEWVKEWLLINYRPPRRWCDQKRKKYNDNDEEEGKKSWSVVEQSNVQQFYYYVRTQQK